MRKIGVVLIFLISGVVFGQTTVTLEDQCNCEVLSGTAVTVPGVSTPTGADIGDVYVNTNTGTIYFWDGDSWELTSSDDQQLQNFTFDSGTNILSLDIENGNAVTVDLSTLDQEAIAVDYDNTTSGLMATNVQDALDEINASAGTVSLVDNGDGTYDFIDASGNITTIADTSVSTLSSPVNGIYRYTDEEGTIQTIDTNADTNPYDNIVSGLAATNVQDAIDEVTANSTDDQQLDDTNTSFNSGTNELTIALEDGGTATADLSALDNPGTDDQNAGEVAVADTAGNFTATDVEGALAELATGSTDDQALSLAAGNILTLEDGGTVNLTPFLDNTDDQAITAFSLDNTTDVLTLTLEDGGTQTVDFTTVLAAAGTDDQALSLAAGNILTLEDGGTVNLTPFLDNTDDQALSLAAGNILTLEDGGTVNLTPFLDNTDDQNAGEVTVADTAGNFTATDVEGALAELATGSTDDQALSLAAGNILTLEDGGTVNLTPFLDNTDDQAITAFSLNNTTDVLTLTLEDGGTQTVDFTTVLAAAGTDDQSISTDGTSGNLSIESGNTLSLNVDDADSVIGNEYNTGSGISGGSVQITDGGGTESVNLISTDTNNDISAGTDGALYLNVASASISETNTTLSFNDVTNVLNYTNELGNNAPVDLSSLNNPGTDDQNAGEVTVADTAGNFTATDVEGALAELATGSTDDQALSLAAGNILTLEDGGTVNLTPFLDNTDDQAITAFSLDNTTDVLTLTLEDGGTQTVDFTTVLAAAGTDDQALSMAAGNILTLEDGGTVNLTPFLDNTDDQNAGEVTVADTAGNFTATDVEGALAELATGSTDDQALSLAAGNILTLEDGGTVNLTPFLDNTDDQAITAFSLDNTTDVLTLTLEDGGTQTVDFTTVLAAAGTDDQALSMAAGNILTLEDGGTVNLTPFLDNTDDQNAGEVTVADTAGNFTATDVEGALAELATGSTDDQALSLAAGNILTLEDGGTVNLTPFLDNTDDQAITAFSLDNTTDVLTLTLEDGGTQTVDFTTVLAAAGTDDQALSMAAGNILTLEDGGTVNLTPFLDNTDDQNAGEVTVADTAGNFTATDVEGALAELATGSTDDQALSLAAGNILTLEDGGTVNLTPFLDNTDDQNAGEVTVADTAGNFTATDVEGALAELATGSTDDQALSLAAGNILTLEDGGTVNLTPFLDNTDDQAITAFSLDNTTDVLTLTLEDGGTQTVDFTTVLAAAGTDDQALSMAAGNILTLEDGGTVNLTPFLDNTDDQNAVEVTVADTAGNFTATDVEGALAELATGSTDDQALSLAAGNILTLEDGGTVNLTPFLDNTDDQAITAFSLDNTTDVLTLTLEDGGTQTVDFTTVLAAAGTDDQALSMAAGNILTLEDGGTVNLTPFLDNTDDQNAGEVTVADTAGNFTATDVEGALAELATGSTDDQALSLAAGNILTLEDGGTVNLTPFLDNTDDQAITAFSLDNTTDVLTLTLEDGGTQTVDFTTVLAAAGTDDQALSMAAGNILTLEDGGTVNLTPFLDNTDDQNAGEVTVADTAGNFTATDVEGALAELATGSTDDQALSLAAGNILTLEDGGTVNLTPFLDNTDNQTLTLSGTTLGITGGNTVNLNSIGSDNQNIANLAFSGTTLTVGIEDGSSQTVSLATLADNQSIQGSGFSGNTLTIGIEDGSSETVDLSSLADNQSIQGSGLSGTTLTIGIEDGSSETVNLSSLANTDNQNIENLGLSGTTLTVGIENGSSQTVDLAGLSDHDWYQVGGTSAPNAIGADIFTQGTVAIGKTTVAGGRTLDVEGDIELNDHIFMNGKEAFRGLITENWLRINNSNDFTLGTRIVNHLRVDHSMTVNASGENRDMRVEGQNDANLLVTDASADAVGIGTNTPDAKLDVEGGTVRFSDYGGDAITGTLDNLLGIEADGDVIEVDPSSLGSDDQFDDEVALRTGIDVDDAGKIPAEISNETNVQEVIQAIAPITSKAARIFYPPSIAINASTNGTGTIDLYAQYLAQFGSPVVASSGPGAGNTAPSAIPTYTASELYYYVTYADVNVFGNGTNVVNMSINENGVLSYEVFDQPADYNSLINVVFVVK